MGDAPAPFSMADVAGTYHESSGLAGCIVDLRPDGTVSMQYWFDVGDMEPNGGAYTVRNGLVQIRYEPPTHLRDWPQSPERLVPVLWGERRFLVWEEQLADFWDTVHHGADPCSQAMGVWWSLFRREGDDAKPATGLPQVPPRYVDYVVRTSVLGKVVAMDGNGGFSLNVGTADGVSAGMVFSRPSSLSELVVRSVDERKCVGERTSPEFDDEPIAMGDSFMVGEADRLPLGQRDELDKQADRLRNAAQGSPATPP
jgi:hypothetical protein